MLPVPPLVVANVPANVIAPDVAVAGVNPVVPPLMVVTPVVELNLLLNVVQSVDVNAPLLVAEAFGTFKVMTGVVVLFATVDVKFVPVVPIVKAATSVTVPVPGIVPLAIKVILPFESTVTSGST